MASEPIRREVAEHSNDILVAVDLMDDTIRDVERHTVEEAILLRHTAMTLKAKAAELERALDLHLVDVMEWGDSVSYKGWAFRKGTKKDRERYDHDEIMRHLRRRALDLMTVHDDPEAAPPLSPMDAVADTLRAVADIYLSPSTLAKVGQLDRYGIPRNKNAEGTVRHWEKGPEYIDVSPIASEVQQ